MTSHATPPLDQDAQKRAAARFAADFVEDGMRVGLGTGTTAAWLIRELAERHRQGLTIRAVATSIATDDLARRLGLPMYYLDELGMLDIALDGADEVDPQLDLIKGLGGALLREKLVELEAHRLVIMVDESKPVPQLGARGPVPVEVVEFAWRATAERLRSLGLRPALRGGERRPFTTDGGNVICDCAFDTADVAALARDIKATTGVVEHGFFLGMATDLVVGHADGTVEHRTRARG